MPHTKIFTPEGLPADAGAIRQLETCMAEGDAVAGVLCADHHLGYSAPIGAAIAYPKHLSPSGVGYDIGCGNKAVATSLLYSDIRPNMSGIMDEIVRRISFGMGQPAAEQTDHAVIDKIGAFGDVYQPVANLKGPAAKQLGTVGAGNHYVDLFVEDRTGRVWVGVHFGSRGFGHKVASGFLSLAEDKPFDSHPGGGEMHSPPVLFSVDEWLGYAYEHSMKLAGEYAYAGRDIVVDKVLDILGAEKFGEAVHNHHNFAWHEPVEAADEGTAWVVRKGSTPLWPGQKGFVGGSMGENAVIIEGAGDRLCGFDALWSAPHGAGRVMSRTEAKGKSKKRWYCRDCGWEQGFGVAQPDGRCPDCYSPDLNKHFVQTQDGKINWKAAKRKLTSQGIHLVGGDADEAPDAYKNLPEVIAAHSANVRVLHTLRPVGVAMAGPHIKDNYKD